MDGKSSKCEVRELCHVNNIIVENFTLNEYNKWGVAEACNLNIFLEINAFWS